jgi:hypothetical protein
LVFLLQVVCAFSSRRAEGLWSPISWN